LAGICPAAQEVQSREATYRAPSTLRQTRSEQRSAVGQGSRVNTLSQKASGIFYLARTEGPHYLTRSGSCTSSWFELGVRTHGAASGSGQASRAAGEALTWTSTFCLVCYDSLSSRRVQLRIVSVYNIFADFASVLCPRASACFGP